METTILVCLTVLIFAMFFAILFRKDIQNLFPRIRNIGRSGVSLSESQTQSQEKRPLPFEQQFDLHRRSPVQVEKEDQIRTELVQRGITSDEDRAKLLTRALATTIIEAACERISLLVFGTQLELLVEINAQAEGMKLEEIRKWYLEVVQPNHPTLAALSFDDYVGFLFRQVLAVAEGDRVKVTNFGREFMQYLVRTGQTHRRAN